MNIRALFYCVILTQTIRRMEKKNALEVLSKEHETLKIVPFPEVVVEEKEEKQKTLFG